MALGNGATVRQIRCAAPDSASSDLQKLHRGRRDAGAADRYCASRCQLSLRAARCRTDQRAQGRRLRAAGDCYKPRRGGCRDESRDRRGDRKSVVEGKRVSVRVDLGGRRIIKKKTIIKKKSREE